MNKRVPLQRYFLFFCIVLLGLFADISSKNRVFQKYGYPNGTSEPIFSGWVSFRLFTSFNHGALWGMGQGLSWLFALLSLVAVVGILYWLFVKQAAFSSWLTVSLGLVLAGTLGNLWDRLGLHGFQDDAGNTYYAVRDFLLFTFGSYHWPVFNFADVMLVTGAIMLVLHSFQYSAAEADAAKPAAAESTKISNTGNSQLMAGPSNSFQ